jgi:predicted secreted protein
MRKLMTLAALCAFSTALYAQAAPAPAAEKPVKEKKICRQEDVTGSIMMARTCHTKEEWAQIDAANSRNAQHALGRDGMPSGIAPIKPQ